MKLRTPLTALATLAIFAGVASARPGGGDSFSGGGGHGGGGGIGIAFELIYWTFRIIVYYPQIGLPILGGILIGVAWNAYKQHQNKDWDSGPPVALQRAIELTDVQRIDPEFSQVSFEDFAFRLFATAHRQRHAADALAGAVGPYLSQLAREALVERAPVGEPVASVVVGALRPFRVSVPADQIGRVIVGLEFEANVTTAKHTYYSVETWVFGRDATVRSKPPGAAKTFPCPNCGAPWDSASTGAQVCPSCSQIVDNGRFDWVVEQISASSIDERPPTVTEDVPERGTDLPTYRQDNIDARWLALRNEDPAMTEATLFARLGMIYRQLNDAWSHNDLAPARGVVSDGLYDYLQYWIAAYKQQGFRNELVDMRITHSSIAKIVRDKWFTAITIRVWGTGKDYVVKLGNGALVRGSKHRERKYSEYWTLIRSTAARGEPRPAPACPNCGAPLDQINQAGTCAHCSAHVTAGEVDWVLSKIEQDDTYRG